MTDKTQNADATDETAPAPTWLVWIARIVSGTALAVVFGYLIYLAAQPDEPPSFDVIADFTAVEERNGQWVLPVTVENTSNAAVTTVTVEMTQGQGEDAVIRQTVLGILGRREKALIEVTFPNRPTESNLDGQVTAYQDP